MIKHFIFKAVSFCVASIAVLGVYGTDSAAFLNEPEIPAELQK